MSLNTEKTYITGSRQFQRYIKKRPDEVSTDDGRIFLSYLAADRQVARAGLTKISPERGKVGERESIGLCEGDFVKVGARAIV